MNFNSNYNYNLAAALCQVRKVLVKQNMVARPWHFLRDSKIFLVNYHGFMLNTVLLVIFPKVFLYYN